MTCIYNETLFAKYRDLAITNKDDLVIGHMYWSNLNNEGRVLVDFMSDKQLNVRLGLKGIIGRNDSDNLKWMIFADGSYDSLHDNNIGTSYNPWLIFDDEETAKACREELKITIQHDWENY